MTCEICPKEAQPEFGIEDMRFCSETCRIAAGMSEDPDSTVSIVAPTDADILSATRRALDLVATYTGSALKELAIDSMLGEYSPTEALAREIAHTLSALGGIPARADKHVKIETEGGF